ncbi:MAG TPA: isochorismatase family protein [Desulfobulbus sp.]|nr:isochorismatase family protein [Desulfobulbus sp.]
MSFLIPEQCCLYVVDPQERLMAHIHASARVVKNIGLMIRLAGTFSLPILANTQYKKGVGPIVPELDTLLTGVPCPDKVEFNGLANAEVRQELDRLSPAVDTLLICGVETHICIYQTAMGALDAGYRVRVVADAVSSRTPDNDRLGQARLREIGAVLQPAEMIIYELLQQAGTPEFKAMLPYLK